MSFRRRIVVLVAAAVAAAVLGASALVYVVMRGELNAQLDDRLRAQAPKAVLVSLGAGPGETTTFRRRVRLLDARADVLADPLGFAPPAGATVSVPGPLGGSFAVAQLVTQQGEVVGGRARLPVTARTQAVATGQANAFFSDAVVGGVAVRMLTVPAPGGAALTIAAPRSEVDGALHRLLLILLAVSGAGVAVAAGLGVLVSRRALAPVRRLTAATEHVAATQDLSRRIDVAGGDDELARMARSFNTMLAALDGARAAQRQLVADASHELRTPLTAVRTSVEALARAPDGGVPAAERAHVLATAQAQLEDLSVLVGDLVDLARPDERGACDEAEDVRLDLLVREAVERARRHAPAATFRVTAQAPSLVRGVPARLHRAVANLLDNAIKHGGAAGCVEVEVAGGEVRVRDHGPGIAATDLPHVFDRFWRAPGARGLPGAGLGLAIVRQAAELHGGSVRGELPDDGRGGVRLVLSLPS